MIRVLVKLILIFALSYGGVKIWYGRLEEKLLVPPVPKETVTAVQEMEPPTESLRKPDDYTIIVGRNIFQAVITEQEQVVEEVKPEVLEPTKLKLSLMGTVSGTERDSRAIISDDLKKKQDIYQVGDSVQGALIQSIERGRVILEVNGVDEVLSLKDREGGGPAYVPSAEDFYNEPPEEIEQPEMVEEPQVPSEAREVPGQDQGSAPVVRPRPVRRPVRRPSRAAPQVPGGIQ